MIKTTRTVMIMIIIIITKSYYIHCNRLQWSCSGARSVVRELHSAAGERARCLAAVLCGACVDKTAFCRPNGKPSERKSGERNTATLALRRFRTRATRSPRYGRRRLYGYNNNITRAGSPFSLLPSVSCLVAR